MKMKDFTPKKELKDGKPIDTGRKRMNEKAFIQNTMKRLSFDNKDTFVCFATSSLDTRYYSFLSLLSLNFSWFLGYIVLNLFLFFPFIFYFS